MKYTFHKRKTETALFSYDDDDDDDDEAFFLKTNSELFP